MHQNVKTLPPASLPEHFPLALSPRIANGRIR
jgi:hypothetical protein